MPLEYHSVCIHTHSHVLRYSNTHTQIHTLPCSHPHTCTQYIHIHIQSHIYTLTRAHMLTLTCMHTHTCSYVFTHMCLLTDTPSHTCSHTHSHSCSHSLCPCPRTAVDRPPGPSYLSSDKFVGKKVRPPPDYTEFPSSAAGRWQPRWIPLPALKQTVRPQQAASFPGPQFPIL